MVLISIELSEEVAARARKEGMLSSEAIAALIEDKLGMLDAERQQAAARLLKTMDELRDASTEDFGAMTEEAFTDMASDIVREARRETIAKSDKS
jgi:hypothetical protein